MTKKDYIAIAALIQKRMKDAGNCEHDLMRGARMAIIDIAYDLSKVFEADNPRFDHDTFIQACGVWK